MDKAIRWLANYWAFIVLIVMVLGAAYFGALNEKKTVSEVKVNGQYTENYQNK